MASKILVVDDQRNMRTTLALMLRDAGYEVEDAEDGDKASQKVAAEQYDLVLTDLKMGATDGMAVLRHTRTVSPLTEVMVMTAFGTIESAVEAMRAGAHDYIQKPFTEPELLVKVQKALEKRKLSSEVSMMASEFRERYHFESIIGRSGTIREVLGRVVRVAPTDATVLITGESGTGKELVARAIHANSTRWNKPFVGINCAAMTETLLESELFGHAKGAFTGATQARRGLFEEANGGTFFFDEIGETPPAFQAKLLRALQEGEIRRLGENKPFNVDVRILAATNRDLKAMIAEKAFREDLYYRLNVARFNLPALRERKEDVPLLVDHFLQKFSQKMKRPARLGDGVLDFLMRYDFPGNIRELENLVAQGVALAMDGLIRLEDIVPAELLPPMRPRDRSESRLLQDVVDRAEREAIEAVLRDVDGDRERAADILGLSTTTLWRKMKRLELVWP